MANQPFWGTVELVDEPKGEYGFRYHIKREDDGVMVQLLGNERLYEGDRVQCRHDKVLWVQVERRWDTRLDSARYTFNIRRLLGRETPKIESRFVHDNQGRPFLKFAGDPGRVHQISGTIAAWSSFVYDSTRIVVGDQLAAEIAQPDMNRQLRMDLGVSIEVSGDELTVQGMSKKVGRVTEADLRRHVQAASDNLAAVKPALRTCVLLDIQNTAEMAKHRFAGGHDENMTLEPSSLMRVLCGPTHGPEAGQPAYRYAAGSLPEYPALIDPWRECLPDPWWEERPRSSWLTTHEQCPECISKKLSCRQRPHTVARLRDQCDWMLRQCSELEKDMPGLLKICSGDWRFKDLADQAVGRGWEVEVWTWAHACHPIWLDQPHGSIKVIYLDVFRGELCGLDSDFPDCQ